MTTTKLIWRCLLAGALLAAGAVLASESPAAAAACSTESSLIWDECSATPLLGGTVIDEYVAYTGPAGRTLGRICRPATGGPYRMLVLNHGLGHTPYDDPSIQNHCPTYAAAGWYVLASNYRPIDWVNSPSGDLCLGEVDDVRAMIDVARSLSYADDSRIAMRGLSLGGCVTLRLHQQGVSGLQAAASLNGPTDFAAFYQHAVSQYGATLCYLTPLLGSCPGWEAAFTYTAQATGGPPGPTTQAQYDARSPITFTDDTAASGVPLAIVQGADDPYVPLTDTCDFAAAVNAEAGGTWDFQAVRYGSSILNYPMIGTAPAGCSGLGTWHTGTAIPPTYPGDNYFAVVDDLAHTSPSTILATAVAWADGFLGVKT